MVKDVKLGTFEARIFAAIAREGGITAAARTLGLRKSFVSRELATLEERLGLVLAVRTTRSLSLTEAGSRLAVHAERIEVELAEAEAAMASQDDPSGMLRITAPFAVIRLLLVPLLPSFTERYPHLRLSFDPTSDVRDLAGRSIDIAVRVGDEPRLKGLVARRLVRTDIVLVAAPAYLTRRGWPQQASDLAEHDVIDISDDVLEPHGDRALSPEAATEARVTIREPSIALDLALAGVGIAVVPAIYVADHLRAGDLVRVLPELVRGSRTLWTAYPRTRWTHPKVTVFIQFIGQAIAERTS